jgi:soluble lytic murein transglycosylase-like protein
MIESLENVLARIEEIKRRFLVRIPARPKREGFKELLGKLQEDNFSEAIEKAAKKYNIEPSLIKAIIKAESNFNPFATSKAGAQGLMQLMPQTAEALGVSNPFDPEQNIDGGVRYLRELLDDFNQNLILALAAYNAGPGKVREYKGVPPFRETQLYIKRVLQYYRDLS